MRGLRISLLVFAAVVAVTYVTRAQGAASPATVYQGARLINGSGGAAIENAAFVVEGGRFTQVGRSDAVKVPAGATRVDLTGKTVMPAIIDAHVHLRTTREELVEDLRRRAYYGVGAAMSLGQDPGELPFQVRAETIPGAARFFTAGRGITMPEPGRNTVPYWVSTPEEGRKAVQELAAQKVDLVKIWVDDRNGKYPEAGPALYGPIIDEAHRRGLRVTAHIFYLDDAKGLMKAGIDAFAHGVRDKDVDDELMAMLKQRPNRRCRSESGGSGREDRHELAQRVHPRRGAGEASGGGDGSARSPADIRHPGPQPRADGKGRRSHRDGDRRKHAMGSPRRDGGHGRCRDDAGAGHRRLHPQCRRPRWDSRMQGRSSREKARTSSSSTRIRSRTSRTHGGFQRFPCAVWPSIARLLQGSELRLDSGRAGIGHRTRSVPERSGRVGRSGGCARSRVGVVGSGRVAAGRSTVVRRPSLNS